MRDDLERGDGPDLTESKHSLQQTHVKLQNYQCHKALALFYYVIINQSILAQMAEDFKPCLTMTDGHQILQTRCSDGRKCEFLSNPQGYNELTLQ